MEKEYLLEHINFNENDIVIDVGACIGEVSLTLGTKKVLKFFLFEPEENEYECIKKNLSFKNFEV